MWQNWFRLQIPGALAGLTVIRVTCVVLCRLLRFSALSHWCGRPLRVHVSFHCEVCVVSPLMSLILRQYPLAVLNVPFATASSCTSCFFFWRCPFLLVRFVIFAKQLRTCAQPLSVCFGYLEAALFVVGSVSARLNGTDVLVYTSTSHCRAYHESGACLQKRCFAVYVLLGKSETVSKCVFANTTADILICVVVCARFFATHERRASLL